MCFSIAKSGLTDKNNVAIRGESSFFAENKTFERQNYDSLTHAYALWAA
jgi:hypothetical protein